MFGKLEDLLGVKLPDSLKPASIQLYEYQPDPAYKPQTVYARLAGSPPAYEALLDALDMQLVAGTEFRMLLPGKWKTPDVIHLDWWTPNMETPSNAAACPFGVKNAHGDQSGWILAQYHEGYIYLRIYSGRG